MMTMYVLDVVHIIKEMDTAVMDIQKNYKVYRHSYIGALNDRENEC